MSHIVLKSIDYNPENLVINAPSRKELKNNGLGSQNVAMFTSSIGYRLGDGNVVDLYLRGPRGLSFGIKRTYELGKPETEANARGWQMVYIFGRQDGTLNKEENEYKNVLDDIRLQIAKSTMRYSTSHKANLPQVTVSGFKGRSEEDAIEFVKPLYDFPRNKETNEPDAGKSPRMYSKLLTSGKGGSKIQTRFKDKERNTIMEPSIKLIGIKGNVLPVHKIESVYYGAHGTKAYTTSVQMKIAETIYEMMDGGLPSEDLITGDVFSAMDDDISKVEPLGFSSSQSSAFASASSDGASNGISRKIKRVVKS